MSEEPLGLKPGTFEAERLRHSVDGLAAGIWRRDHSSLVLCDFAASEEMPPDVQAAFREATGQVSLEQTDLAIVRAVTTRGIAIAEPPPPDQSGSGSPAWLRRFAARQSIALPICRNDQIVGAIAVAFTRQVPPSAGEIDRLRDFARGLGEWSADTP